MKDLDSCITFWFILQTLWFRNMFRVLPVIELWNISGRGMIPFLKREGVVN